MSPQLILAAAGLILSVASLSMVAPSISRALDSTVAEVGLSREEALAQHIIQYRTLEGVYPSAVSDLVSKNYWSAAHNDNGFGGGYTFTVNPAKGLITVRTTISDAEKRALYMRTYKRTFKAVDEGAGVVRTTFVMPTVGATGAPIATGAGSKIPASSTAPDAASNRFWYDTSGSSAVLKVSNGATWVASTTATSGSSASTSPTSANIVSDGGKLPTSGTNGDVRYVYNAAAGTLDTLAYYNGSWNQVVNSATAVANANGLVVSLSSAALPSIYAGEQFTFDMNSTISATSTSSGSALTVDTSKTKWAILGSTPTGLSFNGATGVLSGVAPTKTAPPPSGQKFNVVVSYAGTYGQQVFTLSVKPALIKATAVSIGDYHSCIIVKNGGAKCWGSDSYGATGALPSGGAFNYPADVQNASSSVSSITIGTYASCAIIAGSAKCWGTNTSGTLGTGDTASYIGPVQVQGLTSGVKSIAIGTRFGCAVSDVGAVKCWGSNTTGQLGLGSTDATAHSAADVSGLTSGFSAVSANSSRACALSTTGAVACWGDSYVGNGTTGASSTPVQPTGLASGVRSLSLGFQTACVVMTDSTVKCWGKNTDGGTGMTGGDVLAPTTVPGLTGVSQVSLGLNHGCALLTNGTIKCWGRNTSGQLAQTASPTSISTPVDIAGITDAIGVAAGSNNTCAIRASGAVLCWGANTFSRLGLETSSLTDTPTPSYVMTEAW